MLPAALYVIVLPDTVTARNGVDGLAKYLRLTVCVVAGITCIPDCALMYLGLVAMG